MRLSENRQPPVQYEVKTTNAYRIRSSDFRAYADMTDMWSVTGAIPIKVEVLNHSEYLVSMPVSRTGTIKIETEPASEEDIYHRRHDDRECLRTATRLAR